ncbi:MAG: DegV family EDD domain-containing protein [Candidatus Heimdallarchaeota archaeon]|nr:DegV family EDD domain-containing protein [Candidatus Heimdallarchaeota archaeon]
MANVKIIASSTCDLDDEIVEELAITLVPLSVTFGETKYRERIDLTKNSFYELLENSSHHPTTSQPAPKDFVDAVTPYIKEGREVIIITVSDKLSGTYQSAKIAQKSLNYDKLFVVNSLNLTIGEGLLVRQAAMMAKAGKSAKEILAYLNENIPKTHAIAMMDTLKYMERGGRISKIQHIIGTILRFKPFIGTDQGYLVEKGRKRGKNEAIKALRNLGKQVLADPNVTTMLVGHTSSPNEAEELKQYFLTLHPDLDIFISQVGASVGTHMGPGCFGIAWTGAFDENWLK